MSWQIRFIGQQLSWLRERLLASSPLESGAILLCNESAGERLVVEKVSPASRDDLVHQARSRVDFAPAFVAGHLKAAREHSRTVVFVHTHPLDKWPIFSRYDDDTETHLIPALFKRVAANVHGTLVLGEEGFSGRVHHRKGAPSRVSVLAEIGPNVITEFASSDAGSFGDLFDRSVRAFGERGQLSLSRMAVGIVGLGGTGSIVAQQLAHLGVKSITLIDDDVVEESNLNRVVGASLNDVGDPKVDVAARMINQISFGRVATNAINANVLDSKGVGALIDTDIVFCCTDSHGSRAALNQFAFQFLIPVIDVGVRIDAIEGRIRAMAGRVQMLAPGIACLVCQRLLDSEEVRRDLLSTEARQRDPYIIGSAQPQPAVISLNGTVSSLGVTMFLAAMVGVPSNPRRLNYRISEGIVKPVSSAPDPTCIVCSAERGALAKGLAWPLMLRSK
jgi:molybdopterin/thiamine biosynthesis adenylyltransferase